MKRGNIYTEQPLLETFDDFERFRICVHKSEEWESKALRRRLDAGEVVRPIPGLYARAEYWNGLSRAERLLHVVKTEGVVHPLWTFTHATAALVHGLDVSQELFWPIHYATSRSGGGRAPAHHVHHRFGDLETTQIRDVRVSCLPQTVVDCARAYAFGPALAIADSALHQGKATREELAALLVAQPRRPGNARAQRVLALADPRPESGGESLVRALMIELKLPMPELQAEVPHPESGYRPFRVDFLFRPRGAAPVALELDGLEKYENLQMTGGKSAVQVMARERQREAAITAHGIRVARIGFKQAMDPEFLLRHLALYDIVPEGNALDSGR